MHRDLVRFGALCWGVLIGTAMAVQPEIQSTESTLRGLCSPRTGEALATAARQPVVYVVLSPRMPYALKEWRRMNAAAQSAGFQVLVLRDSQVPDEEWHAAVHAVHLPELQRAPKADEVIKPACHTPNHFPFAVVSLNGCTHPWPILGVMPDEAWQHLLRARYISLTGMKCQDAQCC